MISEQCSIFTKKKNNIKAKLYFWLLLSIAYAMVQHLSSLFIFLLWSQAQAPSVLGASTSQLNSRSYMSKLISVIGGFIEHQVACRDTIYLLRYTHNLSLRRVLRLEKQETCYQILPSFCFQWKEVVTKVSTSPRLTMRIIFCLFLVRNLEWVKSLPRWHTNQWF